MLAYYEPLSVKWTVNRVKVCVNILSETLKRPLALIIYTSLPSSEVISLPAGMDSAHPIPGEVYMSSGD